MAGTHNKMVAREYGMFTRRIVMKSVGTPDIEKMKKTLKYAYLDINYLLETGHNTSADTLTTRLYSNISSEDLDSVANTLADIKDILTKEELNGYG